MNGGLWLAKALADAPGGVWFWGQFVGRDPLVRKLFKFVQGSERILQRRAIIGIAERYARSFLVVQQVVAAPKQVERLIAMQARQLKIDVPARILDSLGQHCWSGQVGGPVGPCDWPPPLGPLFTPPARERAA